MWRNPLKKLHPSDETFSFLRINSWRNPSSKSNQMLNWYTKASDLEHNFLNFPSGLRHGRLIYPHLNPYLELGRMERPKVISDWILYRNKHWNHVIDWLINYTTQSTIFIGRNCTDRFGFGIQMLIWILKICDEHFVSFRTEFTENRDVTLFF